MMHSTFRGSRQAAAGLAFGSLRELHYQFGLAGRLGYVDERDAPKCDSKMVETEKVLSALIRSMRNH